MEIPAQIKQLADLHLVGSAHFVLDVRWNPRLHPPKITVVVDGDVGITIDDCATLSRTLTGAIDEANLLEDYRLEVTTPGIDQPLKLLRQYQKHIGRTLKIELKEKEIVRGRLQQVEKEEIILEREEKQKGKKTERDIIKITFEQIDKTFVMVSFN